MSSRSRHAIEFAITEFDLDVGSMAPGVANLLNRVDPTAKRPLQIFLDSEANAAAP